MCSARGSTGERTATRRVRYGRVRVRVLVLVRVRERDYGNASSASATATGVGDESLCWVVQRTRLIRGVEAGAGAACKHAPAPLKVLPAIIELISHPIDSRSFIF